MRKRFCPKCGIQITEGTLCEACVTRTLHYQTPLVQVSEFNRVIENGRWRAFDELEEVIKKHVRLALDDKTAELEVEPFEFLIAPKQKTNVYVHYVFDKKDVRLLVKLSYMQCDFGQKQKTGYFEGILQLRNDNPEVLEYVDADLAKVAYKGVFISKTSKQKNGVDLYFTHKNHMRLLAQRIHNKFGGILKINSQLFSHNHETSKDIFRVNIYVELPKFKKDSIISFFTTGARSDNLHRQYVKVTSMGRLMQGNNLMTGKRTAFELRYIAELEIYDKKETSVISIEDGRIEILDPETFQSETIANSTIYGYNIKVDDKVTVVKSEHGFILLGQN